MDQISRWSRSHPVVPSVAAITVLATAIVLVDVEALGFVVFAVLIAVGILALVHHRLTRRRVASPGPYPKPAGLVVAAVTGAAGGYGLQATWRAAALGGLATCGVIWVLHVGVRAMGPDFRLRLRSLPDRRAPEGAGPPPTGREHAHIERDDSSAGPIAGAAVAAIVAVTLTFAKRWDNVWLALAAIWAVALLIPPLGAHLSRRYRRSRST